MKNITRKIMIGALTGMLAACAGGIAACSGSAPTLNNDDYTFTNPDTPTAECDEGMTIDGARRVLMEGENPPAEPAAEAAPRRDPDFTRRMEQELRQLRRMLLEE